MQLGGGGFAFPLREILEQGDEKSALERESEKRQARIERYSRADAVMMLRSALELLEQEHKFQHGQILQYKKGLEAHLNAPCGGVCIFIEYGKAPYETELPSPGAPIGTYDDDCRVGMLLPNGAMAEYMTCSRYLEPAPALEAEGGAA